tara:strand:- start:1998 stop:2426 length:429 start_codon:yes stop_codon:yes gene_type:complete
MSQSLNKIIQGALSATALKRIKFKRDPGNLESNESYEGYLLEEDGVSQTATIFIPGLSDSLLNVGLDTIEFVESNLISNLCSLKMSAAKALMDTGDVSCELELKQLDSISTIEQLEFYLNQFDLCDTELLNIYRGSFIDESI